ncbi:MAG: succinate dehydrogenase [Desulfobacteraceae bacterium]|nr:succinate dehydrogenase [Desulfobacteraceae bacterium]
MTIHLKIKRFDPSRSADSRFEKFDIDIPPNENWTVLDLLDHVQEHMDSSLTYYRHSICNRGICKRCHAKINGITGRICESIIPDDGDISLEPIEGKPVIRDLLTQ